MNYNDALDYILGIAGTGSKNGLENTHILLDILGNPHKGMKYVHVAGTNGKGSIVAYIGRILLEAGYRVGRYISPYLEKFEERIAVDEKPIGQEELARITAQVKSAVELMARREQRHPTFFEVVTAIGFMYFREKKCDVVVLEVGLGGRLDSTNVIDAPLLSVITSISRDHTKVLGDTLEAIAYEKAGIIKPGGRVLLYPQDKKVEDVIAKVCEEKGATLVIPDMSGMKVRERNIDRQVFDYGGYKSLEIALAGLHQPLNAALAATAAGMLNDSGLKADETHIRAGLKNARWPGRMEILNRSPIFIIDGAHNEDGARMLAKSLEEYFPGQEMIFIIGVLKSKDYQSILSNTVPLAKTVLTVCPSADKGLPAKILAEEAKKYCKHVIINDTIKAAVLKSLEIAKKNDIICAFGSLYFIGEIRAYFREQLPY